MKPPRKAIGYVRVSTERQAEEGVSLDSQRAKVASYCKLHDLNLIWTAADEGLSGKRADNRPGLQKALELACVNKAVLVVYSLSRLARSTRDCINIAERVEKCGADLASISEKIDTTSGMGRFFFRLMASLGELERDQISERTRAAMGYKRSRSERIGRIPYGYTLAEDGIQLMPCLPEQAVLGHIVSQKSDGQSCHSIARFLNEAGISAKHGGKWHPSTILSILKRETANT